MTFSFVRLVTLGFLTAFMISCTSFPSENKDPSKNNKITYNKDLKECQQDYPESGSGIHIRQWINCMKLKGWN